MGTHSRGVSTHGNTFVVTLLMGLHSPTVAFLLMGFRTPTGAFLLLIGFVPLPQPSSFLLQQDKKKEHDNYFQFATHGFKNAAWEG